MPLPCRRPRPAFTLIELIVVVAILAILIALVLPAVQRVRMAAYRSRCQNNLHQIGVAFQQYHQTLRFLPTGGSEDTGNPPTDRKDWGWTYEILPQLDFKPLYDAPDNAAVRRGTVPAYSCPARNFRKLNNNYQPSDYAGNGGTTVNKQGVDHDGAVVESKGGSNKKNIYSPITPDDIRDGMGQTIFVAEKLVNRPTSGAQSPGGGTPDYSDNESWAGPGWSGGADIMRGCLKNGSVYRTPMADTNTQTVTDSSLNYQFGSAHLGGMQALFGDGSVRTIRYDVDHEVFRRACVRNDNQALDLGDL